MFYYVAGGIAALVAIWYAVAMVWASSVAKHRPELHATGQQTRYGWRCPRCGRIHAPTCKVGNCGGALVWVQRDTRIKCARCHRYFIPHPMLFRQTPVARYLWCNGCHHFVKVSHWKLD